MESRNNEAPGYLRNENDDISEDLAQSLPVDERGSDNKEPKENGLVNNKKEELQHRLREELSAGREEKDFTD